jgi:hypothetical protein
MCWEYLKSVDVSGTVTAIAAMCGIWIAWKGLQTWREQLKGTTEYQLAKEILRAVYDVQVTYELIRRPGFHGGNRSDEEYQIEFKKRYQNFSVTITKSMEVLHSKCIEAKIEWGSEFDGICRKLDDCYYEYNQFASEMSFFGDDDQGSELGKFNQRIIMYGERDDSGRNFFTEQIDSGVAEFEKFLRPIIDKKSDTFFKRLCRPFRAWKKKKG